MRRPVRARSVRGRASAVISYRENALSLDEEGSTIVP